jgi:hypothetical protein
MKRRKAPVLLLSLLVILVGAFVVIGMRKSGPSVDDIKVISDQKGGGDSDADLKKSMAAATHSEPKPGPLAAPGANPGGPSIAIEKPPPMAPPKPDPNGSVRSQWYGH